MSNFTENGTVNPSGSRKSLNFKRAQFVLDAAGTRQHVNIVTGFLDASVVYGSSEGGRACLYANEALCQRLTVQPARVQSVQDGEPPNFTSASQLRQVPGVDESDWS
jgi:hypothetical protein